MVLLALTADRDLPVERSCLSVVDHSHTLRVPMEHSFDQGQHMGHHIGITAAARRTKSAAGAARDPEDQLK